MRPQRWGFGAPPQGGFVRSGDPAPRRRHAAGRQAVPDDAGIGLALDDFGTGYASFAWLRRLPFTTLKLDRSLVAPLPGQPADLAILRAIRDLGRAMRLRLVAEGVETPAQAALLAGLGFEEAQGFLFGGAMPPGVLPAADAGVIWRGLPPGGMAAARRGIA